MVMVFVGGKHYSMDGYLKKNIDYVKDRVVNFDNMMVCVIDGRPGTGKSTIGAQIAYYVTDGKFTLVNETFTSDETMEVLEGMKPGDAIIIDESFDQFNKRTTRSSANMLAISILQRMRSKKVFIFIILPYIYDLDKNIILGLADTFIHCYRKPFGDRGQYAVYGEEEIKKLWLYGRQSYSYSEKIAYPNFRGTFSKFFPLNYEDYETKKQQSVAIMAKSPISDKGKFARQRNTLLMELYNKGTSIDDLSKILSLKQRQIYNIINEEGTKV